MTKSLWVALLTVGLLATPTFGVITASLVIDDPVLDLVGGPTSTTVHVYVGNVGGTSGIMSVSVQVAADVGGVITSTVPVTFVSPVNDPGSLTPWFGVVGTNGGVDDVAASVPVFPPVQNFGLTQEEEALNFEVTAVGEGKVELSILNDFDPSGYSGIVDWIGTQGQNADYTGGTIDVIPEPATLALLALGGLVAVRRRK